MKKYILTGFTILACSFFAQAQNVNIPDTNFKTYLLADNTINTDADNTQISVAEATAYSGSINVYQKSIQSLTGIEAFVNITDLKCGANSLSSLDLSMNKALIQIRCENNKLSTLILGNNTVLLGLVCDNNLLTSLDVSKNTSLSSLSFPFNNLTTIDLSKNASLGALYAYSNNLSSLDVSTNTLLGSLYCSSNLLTSLDVTKNIKLASLSCGINQLSTLDVTKNTNLIEFYCSSNQFTVLDVRSNTKLSTFECQNNSNLTCIAALNSQTKTNWKKDVTASYDPNCGIPTAITDYTGIVKLKIIAAVYNMQGQIVDTNQKGLIIIRYTDGSTAKIMR